MRLLLVEDDQTLSSVLAQGFREHHFVVERATSFADAVHQLTAAVYDVLLFDVMLPGGTGFELCARARHAGLTTPILMLTARDAIDDRVRGLEIGADDYLTKPFAFLELLARVRALARRQPSLRLVVDRIADLEVNIDAHDVRRAGRPISLTSKEFALLECFVKHQGRVLDRAAIMASVWDENHDPFTNAVEVLVNRLRKKIDDGHATALIHTIRGSGYWFGVDLA